MNIQQLEHFLVLVETQSFSRAAAKLHLTQPALSRSIQALEEDLGGRLLERDKGKRLTPLGELALVRARRIRVELSELRRSASLLAECAVGTIKLGLGPTPTAILSVPLLSAMMREFPGIKLLLSGGTPAMQLQELREGTIDAMVVHRNRIPADSDLHLDLFPPTPLGFSVRANHPLIAASVIDYELLARYPLAATARAISVEVMHSLNSYLGADAHFADLIQYQSSNMEALIELVRTSDTVFFGVQHAAQRFIDTGELVQLKIGSALKLSSQFAFITLEAKTMPPSLVQIRSLCAQYLASQSTVV